MALAWLSAGFQSLPLLSTSKLGPSGADSRGGDFVYVLGPFGSLQQTLLWGWEFLLPPQPPQVFIARGFEALFPFAGTLGCRVCLPPQLFLLVYLHTNVRPPSSLTAALLCILSAPAALPQPVLVWMNVSSLTPWLLDFYTVQFSGSSGYFLFLNLLSFFWLCEEESVSTYASILSGSPGVFFLILTETPYQLLVTALSQVTETLNPLRWKRKKRGNMYLWKDLCISCTMTLCPSNDLAGTH